MNILIVDREYPGRLGRIARELVARGHRIHWCSEKLGGAAHGIEHIPCTAPDLVKERRQILADVEQEMLEAEKIFDACTKAFEGGDPPSLIVSRSGGGVAFLLRQKWPQVPHLNGLEGIRSVSRGERLRRGDEKLSEPARLQTKIRNAIPLLESLYCTASFAFSIVEYQRIPACMGYKCDIIPQGVDASLFAPLDGVDGEQDFEGDLELPSDKRIATYFRPSVNAIQGFDIFTEAAGLLHKSHPDVHFVVAGAGERAGKILSAHLPEESFTTIKKMSEPDRAKLFARSSLHVHAAHAHDFGQDFWEPMACGCPILATDTALAREFIRHRINGLLWEPLSPTVLAREALRVLERREEFDGMVESARKLVTAKHTLHHMVDSFESLAQRVAAGEPQPPGFSNWTE